MLDSFSAGLCAAIAGTVLKIADDTVMLGKFVSNSQLDVVSLSKADPSKQLTTNYKDGFYFYTYMLQDPIFFKILFLAVATFLTATTVTTSPTKFKFLFNKSDDD